MSRLDEIRCHHCNRRDSMEIRGVWHKESVAYSGRCVACGYVSILTEDAYFANLRRASEIERPSPLPADRSE